MRTPVFVTLLLRNYKEVAFLWHRIKVIILRTNHSPADRNSVTAKANSNKETIWADGKRTGKLREVRNATATDNLRKAIRWVNSRAAGPGKARARAVEGPETDPRLRRELLSSSEAGLRARFLFCW